MDEIEWMKHIKRAMLLMTIICVFCGLFFLMIAITDNGYDTEQKNGLILTSLILGVALPLFVLILYLLMYITYKLIYSGRKERITYKEYSREIPDKYSPAIASLIYDLKIDIYKDYTATILWLCTKKYIRIKENISGYEFEILKKAAPEFGKSEKYVYDKIKNKSAFNDEEFKNLIVKEAQEKLLITDQMYSKEQRIYAILIVVAIILVLSYFVNKVLFSIIFISVITIIGTIGITIYSFPDFLASKNDTEFKRTYTGKKLAKELQALKNYIKEYTLIREKDIDYIQILEEYIPYAISLGEANTIEKFIKNNEQYRDLIYQSIKNKRTNL